MTITAPNALDALQEERLTASGTWYAWYVVFILTACYTLAFVDSKIPFILVQAIKSDLDLTDTQLGIIAGPAFSLMYAVGALPIAKLSDRNRAKVRHCRRRRRLERVHGGGRSDLLVPAVHVQPYRRCLR